MPRTFYYARVSTREQNLDRQLEAFKTLGAKEREIITDKESGKDLDRPCLLYTSKGRSSAIMRIEKGAAG